MLRISDDRQAQMRRCRFLPIAAKMIVLDAPGTGIVLHRLATSESGSGAVRVEADPIGTRAPGLANDERLAGEQALKRGPVEMGPMRRLNRRVGTDIRKMRRIEHEPQQTAKFSEQRCVVKNSRVNDNQVINRDDESIL